LAVHAGTGVRWCSTAGRVLAGAGIGVLGWYLPVALVDEVLAGCGAVQRRFRVLPARFGVYFVLGLCLFSHLGYGSVIREIVNGLERPLRAAGWGFPSVTALTRLRRRLGETPFELLFGRLCSALSPGTAPWSHICGLLTVAWDGTTVKTAASPASIAEFGKPGSSGRAAAYPQLRLVTLIACGTRALLGAAFGPRSGGERALASRLLACLGPGMLLLADRGFYSYRLWHAAAGTGAQLCWRVKASLHLPAVRPLPDGSWLSVLASPADARRRSSREYMRRKRGQPRAPRSWTLSPAGTPVRVIEFLLTITSADGTQRTEPYRLITTLLDPAAAPAAVLADGYAQRWAAETGFQEFKTYLRGAGRVLRPRTPALARQELWAYLILYQAIRAIMCRAAASAGLDPDQISFTATLHAIRRTLPAARASTTQALQQIDTDILDPRQLVPRRPGRTRPRAVAEPFSRYPSAPAPRQPRVPHHATYHLTTQPADQPHHTPRHQPKRPPNQNANAP
jgi:hypothetical protein